VTSPDAGAAGGPPVRDQTEGLRVEALQVEALRVEALFRDSGALRTGHFKLKSGRHGTSYLEKFQVLQHPAAVSDLCALIAARGRDRDGQVSVDVVVGPTTGGVILAFETARQLGTPGFFAEEMRGADGAASRAFRRGFHLAPGQRVLLVDDILTTGGSLVAMLPPIERAGAELVKAVVLVDRAGGAPTVTSPLSGRTYPVEALWVLDLPTYEPGAATCPACAAGVALETPGAAGAGGAPPRT